MRCCTSQAGITTPPYLPSPPRHSNDHADIRSIDLAPTQDEVTCRIAPYLPKNRPGLVAHLPAGSPQAHLDLHFRWALGQRERRAYIAEHACMCFTALCVPASAAALACPAPLSPPAPPSAGCCGTTLWARCTTSSRPIRTWTPQRAQHSAAPAGGLLLLAEVWCAAATRPQGDAVQPDSGARQPWPSHIWGLSNMPPAVPCPPATSGTALPSRAARARFRATCTFTKA